MTSRDFCFWLQGAFEVGGDSMRSLDPSQVDVIKRHLSLVFIHEIDPSMGGEEEQAKLNDAHTGQHTCVTPGCGHVFQMHALDYPRLCTASGCDCKGLTARIAESKPKPKKPTQGFQGPPPTMRC